MKGNVLRAFASSRLRVKSGWHFALDIANHIGYGRTRPATSQGMTEPEGAGRHAFLPCQQWHRGRRRTRDVRGGHTPASPMHEAPDAADRMKRLSARPRRRRQEMARGNAGEGNREPHDGAAPVSRAAGGLHASPFPPVGRSPQIDGRAGTPRMRGAPQSITLWGPWADPAVRRRDGRKRRPPNRRPPQRASPDAAPAAWFHCYAGVMSGFAAGCGATGNGQ